MRVLLAVLLVGIAGCGGGDNSPGDVAVPTPKSSQAKTDKSPAQNANADPVAALETIGAKIKRNDQGEVVEVSLRLSRKITVGGQTTHLHQPTKITDAGLVYLKGLTNLQNLNLAVPQITDAGLVHLKELTNLQTLNLSATQVTDAGLVHLKGLDKLQALDLAFTKITDSGLVHLKGLVKLQTLDLMVCTQITDAGLVHLKGLARLQELNLRLTKITDSGVTDLKKSLPNCKISK